MPVLTIKTVKHLQQEISANAYETRESL